MKDEWSPTPPLAAAVHCRLQRQGAEGQRWLEGLTALLSYLQEAWSLEIGPPLEGGSEAFVALARRDHREVVLKVGIPRSSVRTEARALDLAGGRGYARLLEYDAVRRAMLLEKLGPRLSDSGLTVEGQLGQLCRTYLESWKPLPHGRGLISGRRKAHWLGLFIKKHWDQLGRPCTAATLERALEFATRRGQAHRAAGCVLVHGDGHGNNALLGPGGGYSLIDPDGLFAEPAGLMCKMIGFPEEGAAMLKVAELLATHSDL